MNIRRQSRAIYSIDVQKSQFAAHVFPTGPFSVIAHSPRFAMRDFSGEIEFMPGSYENISVKISIRSSSLELIEELGAEHRRAIMGDLHEKVLQTTTHPEITFKSAETSLSIVSASLYQANLTGDLTLHGVTKRHSFTAQAMVLQDSIRVMGDFQIKQTDYGIVIPTFAGGGLKDEVKIAFFIICQQQ